MTQQEDAATGTKVVDVSYSVSWAVRSVVPPRTAAPVGDHFTEEEIRRAERMVAEYEAMRGA